MKRILFFNDSMVLAGTEVLLVNILNHLAVRNCAITLLLPQASSEDVLLEKLSTSISVKYINYKELSGLGAKLTKNLMIFYPTVFDNMKGVRETDYDEVVCFKECFYTRMFSKWSIPKILWIHNILYGRNYPADSGDKGFSVWLNNRQLEITQNSYNRYNTVVCVSDACKFAYLDVLHDGVEPKQNIMVLYNAIDVKAIVEKSKSHITPLPLDVIKFVILTRVSPEKRIDRFLNAVEKLKNEGYKFHCYVLGAGIAESMSYNQDLDEVISFLGRQENPYPYIVQSNWMVCTSERESFSLAVLEAMVLKTPVITTNCGGPANIVDGGKYGILVENSGEGIYQGMKKVLDNPQLSIEYSAKLDEAITRYDYDGWLNKIENILDIE